MQRRPVRAASLCWSSATCLGVALAHLDMPHRAATVTRRLLRGLQRRRQWWRNGSGIARRTNRMGRVYPADTHKSVARNATKSSNSFRSTHRAPYFSRHPWRGIVVLARAIAAGEHTARRYTVRQLRRPKAVSRGSCQSGGSHTRMAAGEPQQSVPSKPWSRRCRSIFSSSPISA